MACIYIIDSYEGSNDAGELLWFVGDYIGQAFMMGATPRDICKASFYHDVMASAGYVDVAVQIYACTGTPGTDGEPTGAALATSDIIRYTANQDAAWTLYTFSTPFTLEANTAYCAVLEFLVSSDMGVQCAVDYDNTSPTHDGNYIEEIAGFNSYHVGRDCNFKLYYDGPDLEYSITILQDEAQHTISPSSESQHNMVTSSEAQHEITTSSEIQHDIEIITDEE